MHLWKYTISDYCEASEEFLPPGASVIDVKLISMVKYYTFYLDIIECESVIRNYIRTTIKETVTEETLKNSIENDVCVLCCTNLVNTFFKCKVRDTLRSSIRFARTA